MQGVLRPTLDELCLAERTGEERVHAVLAEVVVAGRLRRAEPRTPVSRSRTFTHFPVLYLRRAPNAGELATNMDWCKPSMEDVCDTIQKNLHMRPRCLQTRVQNKVVQTASKACGANC